MNKVKDSIIAMKSSGLRRWVGMVDDRLRKEALDYHKFPKPGKMATKPTKPHSTAHELSLAYSPGVAYPCLEIEKDRDPVSYTHLTLPTTYEV